MRVSRWEREREGSPFRARGHLVDGAPAERNRGQRGLRWRHDRRALSWQANKIDQLASSPQIEKKKEPARARNGLDCIASHWIELQLHSIEHREAPSSNELDSWDPVAGSTYILFSLYCRIVVVVVVVYSLYLSANAKLTFARRQRSFNVEIDRVKKRAN